MKNQKNPERIPAAQTLHRGKTVESRSAILLLFLTWPVCMIHRFWNSRPPCKLNLFVFRPDISQDTQWYIADTGNLVASILVFTSLCILMRKNLSVFAISLSLLTISVIDLIHYWLTFKQTEWVVFLEDCIMVTTALFLYIRWKRPSSSGRL